MYIRLPGAFGRGIESWIGVAGSGGSPFDNAGGCESAAMTAGCWILLFGYRKDKPLFVVVVDGVNCECVVHVWGM